MTRVFVCLSVDWSSAKDPGENHEIVREERTSRSLCYKLNEDTDKRRSGIKKTRNKRDPDKYIQVYMYINFEHEVNVSLKVGFCQFPRVSFAFSVRLLSLMCLSSLFVLSFPLLPRTLNDSPVSALSARNVLVVQWRSAYTSLIYLYIHLYIASAAVEALDYR